MKKASAEKKWPVVFAADTNGEMTSRLKPGTSLPVFYLIDPIGYLRVAGVNPEALPRILQTLRSEPPIPTYPEYTIALNNKNVQGRPGPKLERFEWLNGKPKLENKIVLLYLMDTNSQACFRQFGNLEEKQHSHPNEVVSILVSDQIPASIRSFGTAAKLTFNRIFESDPIHFTQRITALRASERLAEDQ